ncbi:hypothetical protein [Dechloromonas sp. H13]|uniref:hypothetical protein n=1 Tax=Dechloromonas sp. H13 TaxID=2570193 RepID=UPI0012915EFE|nr:hypothetical protein [Dechloromonas sp. H13]
MRFIPVVLALLAFTALAGDLPLRPSARLLQSRPDGLEVGRCVVYQENGGGNGASDTEYFVRGRVLVTRIETRRLAACPLVPGRGIDQYSRAEFNRLALAQPCVSSDAAAYDVQLGIVRLRVEDWETPHARRAANAGRLYRGTYLDRELKKDMEIELEADLLGACAS